MAEIPIVFIINNVRYNDDISCLSLKMYSLHVSMSISILDGISSPVSNVSSCPKVGWVRKRSEEVELLACPGFGSGQEEFAAKTAYHCPRSRRKWRGEGVSGVPFIGTPLARELNSWVSKTPRYLVSRIQITFYFLPPRVANRGHRFLRVISMVSLNSYAHLLPRPFIRTYLVHWVDLVLFFFNTSAWDFAKIYRKSFLYIVFFCYFLLHTNLQMKQNKTFIIVLKNYK